MGRRTQAVPLEIEIPEEPPVPGTAETAPGKTRRTRAKSKPAPDLGRWIGRMATWTAALAIAGAATFAVYQVDHFLASSRHFYLAGGPEAVDNPNFKVEGVRYAGRERIGRAFEADFGRSIYLMPLAQRRAQLLRIDWIQEASITRLWPNRIIVNVVERKPVAFVALPEAALIDASGVILSQPENAQFRLPVLTGIAHAQSVAMRRERVQMMLEMLKQVGQAASQISEIDVADHRDLQVTLPAGERAYRLHLGNRNYASRMRSFFAQFQEVSTKFPTYTVFDMRLDGNMIALEPKRDGK